MSRRKAKPSSCRVATRRARRLKDPRRRKAALKAAARRCGPAAETRAPSAEQAPGAVVRTPLPQGTQPAAALRAPAASAPVAAAAPAAPPPAAAAAGSAAGGLIDSPIATYAGTFGRRQAERLLWRAGFGPRPGQAAAVAAMGMEAAVATLTRPAGTPAMVGPEPSINGKPLDPLGTWAHDHLWWLDRMVRSEHQLVEKMTLVFHDWFAVNADGVGSTPLMFQQNNLFRAKGLGGFDDLLRAVTTDPAMLVFLSGINNRKGMPNENYARELMELFTLGADRGAYTEADVRELARALTGWRGEFIRGTGWVNFRYDAATSWDSGTKTVFGQSGAFSWEDACRLVTTHPMHPSHFVRKLWSAFIPKAPDAATQAALERRYVDSGRQIRPIVEAILCSPQFYDGPWMVKPPVVFAAGLLRATSQGVDQPAYEWACTGAGQRLFFPPDVSGWDETRWMNTGSLRGRWDLVNYVLAAKSITSAAWTTFPVQTPAEAVASARAFWNDPPLRSETIQSLTAWAGSAIGASVKPALHAQRQNALRMLIGTSADHATC